MDSRASSVVRGRGRRVAGSGRRPLEAGVPMTAVPVALLAVILVLELVSLVILVLAGARHGHEQYQRGYEAGQAAERARWSA